MTRQVVHVGYGDVLTDPVVGRAVRSILAAHAGEYTGKLAGHIGRHLVAFNGRAVG